MATSAQQADRPGIFGLLDDPYAALAEVAVVADRLPESRRHDIAASGIPVLNKRRLGGRSFAPGAKTECALKGARLESLSDSRPSRTASLPLLQALLN